MYDLLRNWLDKGEIIIENSKNNKMYDLLWN